MSTLHCTASARKLPAGRRRTCDVALGAVLLATLLANVTAGERSVSATSGTQDYREPAAAVVALLTASPPPEPLLHATSGRVALLYREGVTDLARLARPRLGLAGFRFDPGTGLSGVGPLITRVEVITITGSSVSAPVEWRPSRGILLDHVQFSPDGRTLSALAIGDGPVRVALFDVAAARGRLLPTPVNAAWGDPCDWVDAAALVCRVIPADRGPAPPERPAPTLVEHVSGAAPVRTYPNLLENAYEDALFEHYFEVEIARVDLHGRVERARGLRGLYSHVAVSPDGGFAVVTRIQQPYSRLVPARRFPSVVEVWDLDRGERRYASTPQGYGIADDGDEADRSDVRRFVWKPGQPTTLGWIERTTGDDGKRVHRWMALSDSFGSGPIEVAHSERPIDRFGWTLAGTPYFTVSEAEGTETRVHVVLPAGAREIWRGSTANRYDDPGRAVRVQGATGPVLEVGGRIFLAGDGLGAAGPQPFLDAFDLRTGQKQRLFTADAGTYEVVLGVLDPARASIVTSRETEAKPPTLYLVQGRSRTALRQLADPYPALARVTRRAVGYTRKDGVKLSGTLYLPAGYRAGQRLPTLIWIYPYEFSDREQAEQLDVRVFRYHKVKGPSPLAAVLAGYAVLVNPTVPILQEGGTASDEYLPQLVASAEAAVDHLAAIGVTDPARVAVGGRSYGAFSSANLLIHSKKFATAIVMSGAYNRTLTPFGFQHERRSFWEATDYYTSISPFFHANEVKSPILLVHGGSDENGGTPPMQARRFFHALAGEGATTRYVELPYEGHHYLARENVLLAAAEMIDWLDRTIGADSTHAANAPAQR